MTRCPFSGLYQAPSAGYQLAPRGTGRRLGECVIRPSRPIRKRPHSVVIATGAGSPAGAGRSRPPHRPATGAPLANGAQRPTARRATATRVISAVRQGGRGGSRLRCQLAFDADAGAKRLEPAAAERGKELTAELERLVEAADDLGPDLARAGEHVRLVDRRHAAVADDPAAADEDGVDGARRRA